ncbi:vacuolar fusion protein MON1 [Phlyctema vagabunda]|uniref:Vacuolar fusion protein MON1 n=1 Tax=Phlyctema vagabunda TaxID=108571 RepID=A0ABR4P6V7_9HELO
MKVWVQIEGMSRANTKSIDELLSEFKSKFKHYMILSSAGKPIYSRHGDQNLINGYIGIIQTLISFYAGVEDSLLGFTAGKTRFVIYIAGPLYFVAISRLAESDAQIRAQLEALYMQILSTLTLPTLTHLFSNRPNTDLRRPLEGTDILLSSLADTFTKGSPSALLSALECLKIRKSQRYVINNTLLKARTDNLLYGLIVAGGRLVSVVRPKRHSLHPSDLQLIFNMLFEASGVKAGGGENWIPLCLPGFNNRGYLYMYVSFLSALDDRERAEGATQTPIISDCEDEIAVLLISADKESFYELKQMRDDIVSQLEKNGSMDIIKAAVREGRPSTTDLIPGTQLKHFLYKSRANVQFTMPSFSPHFDNLLARRRLMTLYHNLHASTHAKNSHLKVIHSVSKDYVSLAWSTPLFEFYCVAGPNASRVALAQGANKVVQWVKREEERIFLVGGAVF